MGVTAYVAFRVLQNGSPDRLVRSEGRYTRSPRVSRRLWVVVSFFALIEVVVPARAGSITNYSHYLVSGESVATLYQSMIKGGPHVGKGKAFASARMEPKVSATTAASRNGCRINRF